MIVSRQQHRVEELVRDDGLDPVDVAELDAGLTALPPGSFAVTGGDLSGRLFRRFLPSPLLNGQPRRDAPQARVV